MAEKGLFINPVTLPLWISGLVFLLFPAGKRYRLFLFSYLFLLLVMMAGHSSRPDRIASIYTFFVASGAVVIEQYFNAGWRRFSQVSLFVLMLTGGLILAPVFCPLISPALLRNHISRLGLKLDLEEGKKGEPIPQYRGFH